MPIRYNGNEYDYDGDVYVGDNPVFKRPRRGVPITYWRHWYRSAVSNTDAIDLSIAVRRKSSEQDTVYIAYVSAANVLTVVSSPVKPYAYDMEWITEATISGVAKCSLAFDGVFRKLVSNDHIVFDTNSLPWLFYVTTANELKGGLLGGSYSTIVAEDVVSVDAVRSVSGYRGLEDKGLLCFYIVNGYLYYRQWLDNEWKTAIRIDDAPFDLVEVRANRTFDWRIALQLVDDTGMMHEIFTYPYYSGWVGIEFLTARATDITLDVHEINYQDLMAEEHLAARVLFKELLVLWAIETCIIHAENVSFTDIDLEIENDYGYKVEITFDHGVSEVEDDAGCFLMLDEADNMFAGSSIEQIDANKITVIFANFNNAIGDLRLYYTDPTSKGEAGQVVPNSDIAFTPTNLVPFATAPPAPVSAWNIGMQKILIEFDKPIIQIVQQTGFDVSGFEPYYSPEGHLVPTEYEVDSITQEDVPTLYIPDFNEGVFDDTVEDNGDIRLFAEDTTVNVLSFNGSNTRVNIPHNSLLKPTSQLTVEFIANSELWNSSTIKTMLSCTEAGGWAVSTKENKSTELDFWISIGGTWKNVGYALSNFSNNKNYHFAGVYDGSKVYLYIDGVLVGSVNATGNITYSYNNSLFIGAEAGKAAAPDQNYYWKGKIKDVRIWNIARTGQQIADNANKQLVGNEVGLVGYWKLDEGTGTTAYDSTTNSINGTIANGTWTTEGGLGDYEELGTYTADPYEIQSALDLRLNWTSTEPEDTKIKGYYAIDIEEPVSITWLLIDNGDVIEVGEDNIGKFIHIKMELSTEDVEVTPVIESIWLEQAYAQANRIQINLIYDGRMKHPQGNVTVDFTGSLLGPLGSQVAPFIEEFKPVLDPVWFNPADLEYLTAKVADITVDVHEITHHDLQLFEPTDIITAKATDISVTVTYVGGGEIPL